MTRQTLRYSVLAATLLTPCSSYAQLSTAIPGMGPYEHGQQVIDDLLSSRHAPRIVIPALTNSITTRPVTVTGTGPLSIVAGNIIINPANAPDSQVNVHCKYPYGVAIIAGNAFVNEGRISSSSTSGSSSTGQLVIDCGGRTTVNEQGNAYINDGYITGH